MGSAAPQHNAVFFKHGHTFKEGEEGRGRGYNAVFAPYISVISRPAEKIPGLEDVSSSPLQPFVFSALTAEKGGGVGVIRIRLING